MKRSNLIGKLENFSLLPLLYIFCQPEDLEILNHDEQLEDCAYEDNSFPLPVLNNDISFSPEQSRYR
jgi:hypothetical protein